MNRYGITINNCPEREERASSAHTAVDRAMSRHIEGAFKPFGMVKIRFIGKCEYTWDVCAEVPFDYGENGKGTKRETVAEGLASKEAAEARIRELTPAHPDWLYLRALRKEQP